MKEEIYLDDLRKEGYQEVYMWEDASGFVYDKHCHEYETKLQIISGEIEVEIDGKKNLLSSGQSFVIPEWVYHSAVVGKDGCKYAVGEDKQ